jgi:hypothetical protein
MGKIQVKYKPMITSTADASIEDGKKIIYITEILKGAFQEYLDALQDHEKVHLKDGDDYFLHDNLVDIGSDRGKIVRKLVSKYNFPELKKKLENPDNGYPWPVNGVVAEYEVAKELSNFHRQCVNVIAYYEESNEETKNWILLFDLIGDDVMNFIKQKKRVGKIN